jgi:hypothetical protein
MTLFALGAKCGPPISPGIDEDNKLVGFNMDAMESAPRPSVDFVKKSLRVIGLW